MNTVFLPERERKLNSTISKCRSVPVSLDLLLNLASWKEPFFGCEKLIYFCISTCPNVFTVCPFRIENARADCALTK